MNYEWVRLPPKSGVFEGNVSLNAKSIPMENQQPFEYESERLIQRFSKTTFPKVNPHQPKKIDTGDSAKVQDILGLPWISQGP